MSDPDRHHRIDYVELTVPDLAAAKAFYTEALGWRFTDYGPGYAGIHRIGGPGEMGGLTTGTPTPGGPLVVLFSEDLAATQAAVEAAGGTVVEAIFDFPGGQRFHFADPAGNVMAVWTTSGA